MKLLVALILVLGATAALGHWGPPHTLVYEGQSYEIQAEPLEHYFVEHPDEHPHVVMGREEMEQNPDAYADGEAIEVMVTSCLRGYIATFEIADNSLRLREFETPFTYGKDPDRPGGYLSEVERYFPDPELRRVDWYTGILVLPRRELERSETNNCSESCILLRIEEGRLTDHLELTGEEYLEFKRKQFAEFREMDDYHQIVAELREEMDFWELNDEAELVQFVFDNYSFDERIMLDFDEARNP